MPARSRCLQRSSPPSPPGAGRHVAADGRRRASLLLKICVDTGHHSCAGYDPWPSCAARSGELPTCTSRTATPRSNPVPWPTGPDFMMPAGREYSAIPAPATWISPASGRFCPTPCSAAGAWGNRIATRRAAPRPSTTPALTTPVGLDTARLLRDMIGAEVRADRDHSRARRCLRFSWKAGTGRAVVMGAVQATFLQRPLGDAPSPAPLA